jgi:Na+-transporting NADH:ubiquinone oxidoreductase subunit NqrC
VEILETMIIILSILLTATILFLASAIIHISKIQQELIEIDKEQHTQNMDIIELLKVNDDLTKINDEQDKALLFIIQHLVEKEKVTVPYMGPIGEA